MKNRRNALISTVIALICTVSLTIGAYFATKGNSDDIESTETSTQDATVTPTPTETTVSTPELTYATEEPDLENGDELYVENIVEGEISFNGMNISQFFAEPVNALGPPLSQDQDGFELFYENFSIIGDRDVDDPENMVLIITIPDPSVVEINGISLDKERDELFSLFGKPDRVIEGSIGDGKFPVYTVKTPEAEIYDITFGFDNDDSKAFKVSICDIMHGIS